MPDASSPQPPEETGALRRRPQVHSAHLAFKAGPLRSRAKVNITSGGLIAIGALVSSIILSVVPLVWVATGPARRRAEKGKQKPDPH